MFPRLRGFRTIRGRTMTRRFTRTLWRWRIPSLLFLFRMMLFMALFVMMSPRFLGLALFRLRRGLFAIFGFMMTFPMLGAVLPMLTLFVSWILIACCNLPRNGRFQAVLLGICLVMLFLAAISNSFNKIALRGLELLASLNLVWLRLLPGLARVNTCWNLIIIPLQLLMLSPAIANLLPICAVGVALILWVLNSINMLYNLTLCWLILFLVDDEFWEKLWLAPLGVCTWSWRKWWLWGRCSSNGVDLTWEFPRLVNLPFYLSCYWTAAASSSPELK